RLVGGAAVGQRHRHAVGGAGGGVGRGGWRGGRAEAENKAGESGDEPFHGSRPWGEGDPTLSGRSPGSRRKFEMRRIVQFSAILKRALNNLSGDRSVPGFPELSSGSAVCTRGGLAGEHVGAGRCRTMQVNKEAVMSMVAEPRSGNLPAEISSF